MVGVWLWIPREIVIFGVFFAATFTIFDDNPYFILLNLLPCLSGVIAMQIFGLEPHATFGSRKNNTSFGWATPLQCQDYTFLKCFKHFGVKSDSIPASFLWHICHRNQNTNMLDYLVKHWNISDKQIQKACQYYRSATVYKFIGYPHEFAAAFDKSGTILPWLYKRGCNLSVNLVFLVRVSQKHFSNFS